MAAGNSRRRGWEKISLADKILSPGQGILLKYVLLRYNQGARNAGVGLKPTVLPPSVLRLSELRSHRRLLFHVPYLTNR